MFNKIINTISRIDEHTLEVIKKSGVSLLIKIFGVVAFFLCSIYLGQNLGSSGLGIINLSHKIITVLLIISLLGLPQFLIKEGAISNIGKGSFFISDLKHTAFKFVFYTGLLICSLLWFFSGHISIDFYQEPELRWPLAIAAVGMFPQLFTKILASLVLSFRKVWQSNLFGEKGLNVFLVLITFLLFYVFNIKITVITAALVFAISHLLVLVTSYVYWKKLTNKNIKKPKDLRKQIIRRLPPFYLIFLLTVLTANVDVLILGWLTDIKNVGLYTVALQIAFLTTFVLQVTNTTISPKLAVLYAESKLQEIETMVKKTTFGLIFIGLFTFLLFSISGELLLSLWGTEFVEAYMALLILSFGQLFNVGTGCTAEILTMCGFEKILLRISIISLIFCVFLHFILIPKYGFIGAAIANAIRLIFENVFKLFFVKKYTKINTLPNFFKT